MPAPKPEGDFEMESLQWIYGSPLVPQVRIADSGAILCVITFTWEILGREANLRFIADKAAYSLFKLVDPTPGDDSDLHSIEVSLFEVLIRLPGDGASDWSVKPDGGKTRASKLWPGLSDLDHHWDRTISCGAYVPIADCKRLLKEAWYRSDECNARVWAKLATKMKTLIPA